MPTPYSTHTHIPRIASDATACTICVCVWWLCVCVCVCFILGHVSRVSASFIKKNNQKHERWPRASAKDFVLQTLSRHCTCSRMCLGRSGGILQRGPETCVDHPRAVRGHCSPSTALPRFGGAAKTRFTFLAYVYAKTRFTFLALKPVLPLSVAPPPLHCVLNESSSSPLLLSLCIE